MDPARGRPRRWALVTVLGKAREVSARVFVAVAAAVAGVDVVGEQEVGEPAFGECA